MISLPEEFVTPEVFAAQIRTLASFNSDALPKADVSPDPHLTPDWFGLLSKTAIAAGTKLALLPCGGAWLPVMWHPVAAGRIEGLSNFYTPVFGFINGDAVDESVLLQHFRRWRNTPGLSELRFAPMDPEGRDFCCLSAALRRAGWWVGDYFCFGNWYHHLGEGGWAAYLANRPGRVRTTLARAERRLGKVGFEIEIVTQRGEMLDEAIRAFVDVYGSSWKMPEPYPEFIPGLCQIAAAHGYLRLAVLRVNRQPIAAQLWLVAHGTAYIVKLAYDPGFAHFSPGSVLTAAMFRSSIEDDQVSCIDYLIGDDAYKAEWMTERRERRGVIAFNPGNWGGFIGRVRQILGARLRSFVR